MVIRWHVYSTAQQPQLGQNQMMFPPPMFAPPMFGRAGQGALGAQGTQQGQTTGATGQTTGTQTGKLLVYRPMYLP